LRKQAYEAALKRLVVTTEKGLLWEIDSDLLSNCKVSKQHELLDQHVRL
jgi:hypothetical protein